jgi:hypothetical protein
MNKKLTPPTAIESDRLETIAQTRTRMRRTQICLTEFQHRALTQEAAALGISMSELLRRIIDAKS